MKLLRTQWRVFAIVGLVAASLTSAPRRPFSSHEKAFYADPAVVEFVNPGLNITVNSASISTKGIITVVYTVADPNGLPLDAAGVTTPGAISLSFIAAVLPNGVEDYTAYTTRAATGTVIATTQQPGADSGGTTTPLGPGQYQYVFHTTAPAGFDATATHTIGIYGSRNLTAYNLGTNYASTTFNFVPNGAKVTQVHDIIETASCNTCHDQLSAHGGSRRGMDMCVLCHTPQNIDPNTGRHHGREGLLPQDPHGRESAQRKGWHAVYSGHQLHSGPSTSRPWYFPADHHDDPRRCEICHSQTTGRRASQPIFMTNPTRAACGACHDDVNFATGVESPRRHPELTIHQCANCHIPQGEMDFDASIMGAHVAPTASSLLSGLVVEITSVANGTAGSAPVVTFTVLDRNKNAVPLSALGSISFTMAGPTTDYGYTSFGSDVDHAGIRDGKRQREPPATQRQLHLYVHPHRSRQGDRHLCDRRRGAAQRDCAVLAGEQRRKQSIQYGAPNPVSYFSVDGSPVAHSAPVVALGNCNQCHVALSLHGTLRNNTEYCVMCHNPSNTDASTRASATNRRGQGRARAGNQLQSAGAPHSLRHQHAGLQPAATSWSVSAAATTTSAARCSRR